MVMTFFQLCNSYKPYPVHLLYRAWFKKTKTKTKSSYSFALGICSNQNIMIIITHHHCNINWCFRALKEKQQALYISLLRM